MAKKIKEEELNIIELHQEQLREARIKLMGVLEAYVLNQGMPLREAIRLFAASNMWELKKASQYLVNMSENGSPFKSIPSIKNAGGA